MATILIVDDEPAIADNVVFALQKEGFDPVWVDLGAKALEVLRDRSVDLVILDVGLPDGSGFEFCKQIREAFDVPVLFLTARGDEIDRVVGLEIGADDYVVKPFSPRELTARVKVVLRRIQRTNSTTLSEGAEAAAAPRGDEGLQLDTSARVAHYGGRRLDLTKSEWLILALLAGKPGRVFSRSEIMQAVWDEPAMSTERAVDTHIKTLRAKLKDAGAEGDPIHTHRGVGYSFSPSGPRS